MRVYLVLLVVGFGLTEDDVQVQCVKCRNGDSSLNAAEGDDITVRYTITNKDFDHINVTYNNSHILSANSSGIVKHTTNESSNKRFSIPDGLTRKGTHKFMFEFNLTDTSDKDDGQLLNYELKLKNGSFLTGNNLVSIDSNTPISMPSIPLIVLVSVMAMLFVILGKLVVKYKKRAGRWTDES